MNGDAPKAAGTHQRRKRFLIGQLKSSGDCLYATTVARQIKNDYSDCHLTWAIGSMYRSILDGNPHIDEIWEVPLTGIGGNVEEWEQFEREAHERKRKGDFDEIFLTQIAPGNLHNYDGGIRSSIFRGYPGCITVPVSPVLRLSSAEVEKVHQFAEAHRLLARKHVILFEASPKSDQSFVTFDFAIEVAQKLVSAIPDACVILSSDMTLSSGDERVIDGSILSLRENAELTKFCSLLVGCSSGVSWICTSDWAKPLPTLQLLKPDAFWFASMAYDFTYWGLSPDTVIEMTPCPAEKVVCCISSILRNGFEAARSSFHQHIRYNYIAYRRILSICIQNGKLLKAIHLILINAKRNKVSISLLIVTIITIVNCCFIFVIHILRRLYNNIVIRCLSR